MFNKKYALIYQYELQRNIKLRQDTKSVVQVYLPVFKVVDEIELDNVIYIDSNKAKLETLSYKLNNLMFSTYTENFITFDFILAKNIEESIDPVKQSLLKFGESLLLMAEAITAKEIESKSTKEKISHKKQKTKTTTKAKTTKTKKTK